MDGHVIIEAGYNDERWCEEHQRVERFVGMINLATRETTVHVAHGIDVSH